MLVGTLCSNHFSYSFSSSFALLASLPLAWTRLRSLHVIVVSPNQADNWNQVSPSITAQTPSD